MNIHSILHIIYTRNWYPRAIILQGPGQALTPHNLLPAPRASVTECNWLVLIKWLLPSISVKSQEHQGHQGKHTVISKLCDKRKHLNAKFSTSSYKTINQLEATNLNKKCLRLIMSSSLLPNVSPNPNQHNVFFYFQEEISEVNVIENFPRVKQIVWNIPDFNIWGTAASHDR